MRGRSETKSNWEQQDKVGLAKCGHIKLPSQVHIQSRPVEALFWSCRSKGYLDDCTIAACMDQMFETEEREKQSMVGCLAF